MNCKSGGLLVSRPHPLEVEVGGEALIDLYSDLHIGSPQVDYAALGQDFERSRRDGARILIGGDVFDAILTRDRKRYTPDGLHPRLQGRSDLLNESLAWALELLGPHAASIDMVGFGNHEETLERHYNIDPVALLLRDLNGQAQRPVPISYGGYGGFVLYQVRQGSHQRRFTVFYHHGTGQGTSLGGCASEFTELEWVEGADVYWLQHRHAQMATGVTHIRPPGGSGHEVKEVTIKCVRTGAYMKSYRGQSQASVRRKGRKGNYAADKHLRPYPCGGARLRVSLKGKNQDIHVEVTQ